MKIHFIGIGGIGMSAAAQYFLLQGSEVSGSDTASSKVTDLLQEKGAEVFLDQKAENLDEETELVVYTLAVAQDNPELLKAKELGIKTISYPEALGLISKDKYTIAISGTHGKTTTTAMIAKIMIDAGLSPTVIAGSLMTEYGSNFVLGNSKYFVVEACEYKESFLHLEPNVLVITNIEEDHLDYYKDLKDIQRAFLELTKKLKKQDFLICDIENPNLEPITGSKDVDCNIIDYRSISSGDFKLSIPGDYNKENAKAALALAAVFEIKSQKALNSLEDFKGTWRRLEERGKTKNGALVFDDYAHHPSEIKASLSALKEISEEKKIIIVFQPHLFSRTKKFLKEFALSFNSADEVILAPIYAAREKDDGSINSDMLREKIKKLGLKTSSLKNFGEIENYLQGFNSDYIIVTMGAGDIYMVADHITNY